MIQTSLIFAMLPGYVKSLPLLCYLLELTPQIMLAYAWWVGVITPPFCQAQRFLLQWWGITLIETISEANPFWGGEDPGQGSYSSLATCSYTLFYFEEARKGNICASDRQLPSDTNLISPAVWLLAFPSTYFSFLSLRGYDNTSHIVFINITCFLDMASVSARRDTWQKHFSLAQHWFYLCRFPGQEKCLPTQI